MKTRVALLHNIMAPYRFPLFRALAQEPDIDLTVLFLSRSAKNRKWDLSKYQQELNFVHKILPHWILTFPLKEKIEYIINPTYLWELIRGQYEVIITAGWLDFSCQLTYLLAPVFGYKYIIWSESTANEASLQRTLTLPFVKWAVKRAAACIAIGEASKEYFVSLGADPQKVYSALSTVDIDHFTHKSAISQKRKRELRKQLGLSQKAKLVLYVGQFIERKGIDVLINAYKKMKVNDRALLLLGYGPLETSLREKVKREKVKNVHFLSHTEIDQMPEFYALADVFVLPSREETWGLVVNEAMAAGLPVIVSARVGCAADLVEEGKNGYVFPNEDDERLSLYLDKILSQDSLQKTLSQHSQKLIRKASPQKAAQVFKKAILSI